MKRISSLWMVLLALTVSLNVSAQVRKSWDFRTLSQETIDNILADAATWTPTMKDDGSFDRASDATKISGELKANGIPIQELQGLTFGTAGLSKNNNFMIANNRFRMTRNNMEIIFPKLAPGQTVTIRARSANGTATNRGLTAGNSNLEYISGPKDGICVGGQSAEIGTADYPVDEDGNFTLVWKVREDLGTTDSVDVVIKTVTGGLDFAQIYIDKGDDIIEETKKIAYLYDSSKEGYDVESDYAYAILSGTDNEVEAIDIKDFTAESVDTVNALESNYDLVIVSEGPNSKHKFASSLKGMVNRVPMLNMKSFFYKSGVWGWGAGVNPSPATGTIVLTEAGAAHPVFGSLGYGAGDEVELYTAPEEYTGNIIQGYTVSEGSYIAGDDTLATVGDGINAIHEHGKSNTYMLYPFSSDAAIAGVEFTEDATNLLLAIVDYLADTKSTVRQANKPTISQTYENNLTVVELTTSIQGATIYYTVDGTEPTTASPVYTEPLSFTEATTVKAMIVCQGYNDSDVASAEILIKQVLNAPAIAITRNTDNSVVTLSGAPEGTTIYFNFVGSADAATSQAYVDTIPMVLTEPATIYAFVAGGDYINSELASAYVGIENLTAETIRLDTLTHFDANPTDWFLNDTENGGSGEAKAYYFNGKNAWNHYTDEVIGTEPVLGEDGVQLKTEDGRDSVRNVYAVDPAALKVFNPLNENGWVIKSAGQVLTLEGNLDAQPGVGNGAANRFAEEAVDAVAGAPSKGCITFGGKTSGDPYTATIETTGKHAAPFDVVVMAGNGDGGAIHMNIEVSTDGTTWTKIGDVKFAGTKRYWKRTRVAYNEIGEVYVRVAHVGGKTKAQVYDIFLFNNGEYSKQYVDEALGIELPSVNGAEVIGIQIYNASGIQQSELGRGLNIVRQLYSDGSVKVLKVMGK